MSKKLSPQFPRSSIDGKLREPRAAQPSRKTNGDPMLKENAPRIRTEVQVMFFDTDCAAVVHNIAYLRFIEVARTFLAEKLGLGLAAMAETQKYPVVVRTEIDYRRAAKL